jgi:hypothetical protein
MSSLWPDLGTPASVLASSLTCASNSLSDSLARTHQLEISINADQLKRFESVAEQINKNGVKANVDLDIPFLTNVIGGIFKGEAMGTFVDTIAKYNLDILVGFASGVAYLVSGKGVYAVVATFSFGASFLARAPPTFTTTWKEGGDLPEAQLGDESIKDAFEYLFQFLLSKLGIFGSKPKIMGTLYSLILNWGRIKENLPQFLEDITRFVEKAFSLIYEKILGKPWQVVRELGIPAVDDWRTKCTKTLNDLTSRKVEPSSAVFDTFVRYTMEGRLIQLSNPVYRSNRSVARLVDEVQRSVAKAFTTLSQYSFHYNAPRMEPLSITLAGNPGVGKTKLVPILISSILPYVLAESQLEDFRHRRNDFVYSRQNEQSFWDGYCAQFVTVFDDFGQQKDDMKADNEFMDLIRCGNMFPNILHMADLGQKGNTVFSSKILIMTTNMERVVLKSIEDPRAVERRLGFCFEQTIRAGYCLCLEKRDTCNCLPKDRVLNPVHTLGSFDTDVFEFHQFKYVKGSKVYSYDIIRESVFTFDELCSFLIDQFHRKAEHFDDYKDQVDVITEKHVVESLSRHANWKRNEKWASLNSPLSPPITDDEFADAQSAEVQMEPLEETQLWHDSLEYIADNDAPPEDNKEWFKNLLGNSPVVPLHAPLLKKFGVSCPATFGVGEQERLNTEVALLLRELGVNDVKCLLDLSPEVILAVDARLRVKSRLVVAMLPVVDVESSKLMKLLDSLVEALGSTWESTRLGRVISDTKVLIGKLPVTRIIAGLGATLGFISMIKSVLSIFRILDPTSQSFTKAERRVHKQSKPRFSPRNVDRDYTGHDYGSGAAAQFSSEHTTTLAENATAKNMYAFCFGESKQSSGFVLFIRTNYAIMPLHYLHEIYSLIQDVDLDYGDASKVTLRGRAKTYVVTFGDILQGATTTDFLDQRDLVLVRLPSLPEHKDIVKNFIDESKLGLFKKSRGFSAGVMSLNRAKAVRATYYASTVVEHPSGTYCIQDLFKYATYAKRGDCGTILYSDEPNMMAGSILAMHVAGYDGTTGFSSILTSNAIEHAIKASLKLPVAQAGLPEGQECLHILAPRIPAGTNFCFLSKNDRAIAQPVATRIVRSKFFEGWGAKLTAPARLVPFSDGNVWIDPMFKTLAKYSVYKAPPELIVLNLAWRNLAAHLLEVSGPLGSTEILGYYESAAGIDGDPFIKGIPRNTSAGFPLGYAHNADGKKHIWGSSEMYDFTTPLSVALERQFYEALEHASNEERPVYYFVDFLKDERRPLLKVADGSTRLISGAPVLFQLVFRSLFMRPISWFMRNRVTNSMAPGINPFSAEWHNLALHLRSRSEGRNVLAGDFGNFDGSQVKDFHYAIRKLIDTICDDEYGIHRTTVWEDIVSSIHLNGDVIYLWNSKLASGTPGTTTINTLYSVLLFLYAWIKLHPRGSHAINDFWYEVYICTFGDDHILDVSDEAKVFFNGESITKVFTQLGLKYTDTKKEGPPVFGRLEDQTFLKRGFRFEPVLKRYVAPLELAVILETPYWVDQALRTDIEHHVNLIQDALDELSLHGKDTFKRWSVKLIGAMRDPQKAGIDRLPIRTDWLDCLLFITGKQVVYE